MTAPDPRASSHTRDDSATGHGIDGGQLDRAHSDAAEAHHARTAGPDLTLIRCGLRTCPALIELRGEVTPERVAAYVAASGWAGRYCSRSHSTAALAGGPAARREP